MAEDNVAASNDPFRDAAKRSQDAGIADESAAYESAIENGPTKGDEGEQDKPGAEEAAAHLGDFA